jgi:hypothetical protein
VISKEFHMRLVRNYLRALCYLLSVLLVIEVMPTHLLSQDANKIKNVRFEILGTQVVIRYDLAVPNNAYRVRVVLRKESEKGFVYVPRLLSGDVGEGEFTGPNRQVTWDFLAEFPGGLDGDDFYFVVEAEKAPWKLSPWYYIVGGVAAVGAGAAYLLTQNKTDSGSLPAGFQLPVGRPGVGQ